jgi:hypothetical protein
MSGMKLSKINFILVVFTYKYGYILWDVASCSPLKANRLFGVASILRGEE